MQGFNERLCELLAANMALQARAGADCVAIFDTAAGTLNPAQFARHAAAPLAAVVRAFRAQLPAHAGDLLLARHRARRTGQALRGLDLQCLGIDWRHDLIEVLQRADGVAAASRATSIRNGCCCRRPSSRRACAQYFERLLQQPAALRAGWVCGLGPRRAADHARVECQAGAARCSGRCSHDASRWPTR